MKQKAKRNVVVIPTLVVKTNDRKHRPELHVVGFGHSMQNPEDEVDDELAELIASNRSVTNPYLVVSINTVNLKDSFIDKIGKLFAEELALYPEDYVLLGKRARNAGKEGTATARPTINGVAGLASTQGGVDQKQRGQATVPSTRLPKPRANGESTGVRGKKVRPE
jgi:hypothetical protein